MKDRGNTGNLSSPTAVDLFCGCGGVSEGLIIGGRVCVDVTVFVGTMVELGRGLGCMAASEVRSAITVCADSVLMMSRLGVGS